MLTNLDGSHYKKSHKNGCYGSTIQDRDLPWKLNSRHLEHVFGQKTPDHPKMRQLEDGLFWIVAVNRNKEKMAWYSMERDYPNSIIEYLICFESAQEKINVIDVYFLCLIVLTAAFKYDWGNHRRSNLIITYRFRVIRWHGNLTAWNSFNLEFHCQIVTDWLIFFDITHWALVILIHYFGSWAPMRKIDVEYFN